MIPGVSGMLDDYRLENERLRDEAAQLRLALELIAAWRIPEHPRQLQALHAIRGVARDALGEVWATPNHAFVPRDPTKDAHG